MSERTRPPAPGGRCTLPTAAKAWARAWARTLCVVGVALAASPLVARGQGCTPQLQRLPAGEDSEGLVAADFDGAFGTDLATTDGDGSLLVFLNRGDGTFADGVALPMGGYPLKLVTADFDGTNGPDLAAGDFGGSVHVFMNNGDGSFRSTAPIATGPSFALVVADFDGVNGPDLAVTDPYQPDVALLLNQGDGSFAPPITFPAPEGWAIAAGDFDGTGGPDIVVSASDLPALFVLMNNGDGSFSTPIELPLSDDPLDTTNPIDVAVGDLDASLGPDIVATTDSDETVVFLNAGGSSFAPPTTYPTGAFLRPVALADLDGGGALDIVAAAENELWVLRGLGDGTFEPPFSFGSGDTALGLSVVNALVVAQLDAAPGLDVGLCDWWESVVIVIPGDGAGSFRAPVLPEPRYDVGGGVGQNWAQQRVLTGLDLDGSAGMDVVLGVTNDAGQATVSSWLADAGGGLVHLEDVLIGGALRAVAAGDLDGDHFVDVVVATRDSVVVLRNDGTGRLRELGRHPGGGDDIALADIDGRNGPDVVTAQGDFLSEYFMATRFNDGRGGLSAPVLSPLPSGASVEALAVADLVPGAALDAAVALSPDGFVILAGDGTGTFVEIGIHAAPGLRDFADLAAGELDGQPGIDIALLGRFPGDVAVFSNDGAGGFSESARHHVGAEPEAVLIADLDGADGLDVIVANAYSDDVAVLLNDGAGGLLPPSRLLAGDGPSDVALVDIDRTLGPEMVVVDFRSNELTVMRGCVDLAPAWLLRNDAVTSLHPLQPPLADVLSAGLRLAGPNGVPEAGEGPDETLPGSSDDDDAYLENVLPGATDPDPLVASDPRRPLVFFQVSLTNVVLRVSKDAAADLRFDY